MVETRHTALSPWPVRVLALLLLTQALLLVLIGAYLGWRVDWETVLPGGPGTPTDPAAVISQEADLGALFIHAVCFGPTALLLLLTSALFLLRRKVGWLMAMFAQALLLLTCLLFYIRLRQPTIYPLMLLGILLVLYLNSEDVRVVFYGRPEDDALAAES